jgi:hypothetical protein
MKNSLFTWLAAPRPIWGMAPSPVLDINMIHRTVKSVGFYAEANV